MSVDVGQQIQSVKVISSRISFICKQQGMSVRETEYIRQGLQATIKSLEFLRNHRDLICDAVRAAKELDAAAPRE